MDLGLKDMRALVAASSQGLGAATALQLTLEGAKVAINGRSPEKLAKSAAFLRDSANADVIAIPGDVARPDDVRRLVDDAAKQLGGIDILVTNCGGPPSGQFESFAPEDWQKAFDLVLMSAVNLIRIALPLLRLSENPSILAITSVSTKQPVNNLILSNSIRMGVAGLVKTLADELGPRGIRVNAIMPGMTRTERITQVIKKNVETSDKTVQDALKDMTSGIPLGRLGEPDEFGKVAAFLCSPAASYIHGAMIPVDGGYLRATI
jgi:3-oxoacyl-[acyl-carrier protein] reductase